MQGWFKWVVAANLLRSKQMSPVWCSHVPTPATSQQFVRGIVACLDIETCCGFICVKRLEGTNKHPPIYCLEVSLKVWHHLTLAWWAEYRFMQLIQVKLINTVVAELYLMWYSVAFSQWITQEKSHMQMSQSQCLLCELRPSSLVCKEHFWGW